MPSPIGHSLMGYIICRATVRRIVVAHHWKLIALCVLAANAPDLDFLPGLFAGDLGRYHHGPSHSIAFAVFFGIIAGALFSRRIYAFGMGFSLYLSHVLLDYLVRDPSPPLGIPLFWPFTDAYYMAPFAFYRPFNYPISFVEPILSTVFNFHNFLTMITEILFLLPALVFVSWYKRSTLSENNVSVDWRSRRSAEE
jgi:inner membrane protein